MVSTLSFDWFEADQVIQNSKGKFITWRGNSIDNWTIKFEFGIGRIWEL